MQTPTPDNDWKAQLAARSIDAMADEARNEIRRKITAARERLDEAERRLDAGDTPSTCGVLQGAATDLDLAVGRLAALRDAKPAIGILASIAGAGR